MRWAQAHPTKKPAHHGAGFLFSDRNGGVYFSTEPSVVICRLISSLTLGTYVDTPKSERLSVPVALKPIDGLPLIGCLPIRLSVASSTTGRVTPCTVRSPVTRKRSLPSGSTLVLL